MLHLLDEWFLNGCIQLSSTVHPQLSLFGERESDSKVWPVSPPVSQSAVEIGFESEIFPITRYNVKAARPV